MSPVYHRSHPLPLQGFQLMKKRPATFKCTLQCALDNKFIMDHHAMERHAQEEEHRLRVQEKEAVEWAQWNMGAQAWEALAGERWADPEQEMARQSKKVQEEEEQWHWQPSEEEAEAEREKRAWILEWIEAVQAALLAEERRRAQEAV